MQKGGFMEESKNTKTNVVGIGHNNTYSKEQYEKMLSRFHYVVDYAVTAIHRVEHLFDEAFTGYENSNRWQDKLKPFEVHERRNRAQQNVRTVLKSLNDQSKTIEAKAKANDLKLEVVEEEKRLQKLDEEANKKGPDA
jgi:hypothetical protein